MIEAFSSNVYNIIGAVLLACLGGYLVWRNGFKSRHADACSTFCAAFEPELASLRANPRKDRTHLLLAAFSKHLAAVREFSRYLPWWERFFFLASWKSYLGSKSIDAHNLEQYSCKNTGEQQSMTQLAIGRLETLLWFARHR